MIVQNAVAQVHRVVEAVQRHPRAVGAGGVLEHALAALAGHAVFADGLGGGLLRGSRRCAPGPWGTGFPLENTTMRAVRGSARPRGWAARCSWPRSHHSLPSVPNFLPAMYTTFGCVGQAFPAHPRCSRSALTSSTPPLLVSSSAASGSLKRDTAMTRRFRARRRAAAFLASVRTGSGPSCPPAPSTRISPSMRGHAPLLSALRWGSSAW